MDRKEFEQMAVPLRRRLVSKALAMTGDAALSDDIAQDTLLKLWQMRERLDSYRAVDGLALIIARNLVLDHLRRKAPLRIEDVNVSLFESGTAADALIEASQTREQIDEVLSRLAPSQEAVIKMRHIDGMEISEIASVLATTENNVRVLLCRARSRVKTLFIE